MTPSERETRLRTIRGFVARRADLHYFDLRALSTEIIAVLPDEEMPYAVNNLMERLGDFYGEVGDWEDIDPDEFWKKYYGDDDG